MASGNHQCIYRHRQKVGERDVKIKLGGRRGLKGGRHEGGEREEGQQI